jgi:hypothetical protein
VNETITDELLIEQLRALFRELDPVPEALPRPMPARADATIPSAWTWISPRQTDLGD